MPTPARHGFRSVNGSPARLRTSPSAASGRCRSSVPIARPPIRSSRPRWGRPGARSGARVAGPSGSPPTRQRWPRSPSRHRAEMAQFATADPGRTGRRAGRSPMTWQPPCQDGDRLAAPDPADVEFVPDAPPIATADSTAEAPPECAVGRAADRFAGARPDRAASPPPTPAHGEDIETVAARRAARAGRASGRFGWPLPGLPTAHPGARRCSTWA